MKKLTKVVMGVAALTALSAGAVGLVACGESSATGEAYGLVHTGGYVGGVTITVKGDKVTELSLTEACLPTYVTVGKGTSTESEDAAIAAISTSVPASDYVAVVTSKTANEVTTYTATAYYKTVSFGNITLTFDAEAGTYKSGSQTMAEVFANEDNCKAYHNAVMNNEVSVSINGSADKTVLTKAALSKDENGYWGAKINLDYSRWQLNRDATVNYVLTYGVENLTSLVKSETAVTDSHGVESYYWMDGTISTGATWSDLNSDPEGYFSYAQLILNAYNAAK